MKLLLTLLSIFCLQIGFTQNLVFSNADLKSYLLTENSVDVNGDEFADTIIDVNGDNEIQFSEALLVQNLVIGPRNGTVITSIQDIHQFSNLKRLTIPGDFGLTEISNLQLDSLEFIRVSDHNSIRDIDLSDLPNLKSIFLEGLNGVLSLNLKNGSYAKDAFSLFYTYVQYACVDSIAAEYNHVAQHLVNGGSISTNCSVGTTDHESKQLIIFPNPTNGIIYITKEFESATLYDMKGTLIKMWDGNLTKVDIQHLDGGLYWLMIRFPNQEIMIKKIIRK